MTDRKQDPSDVTVRELIDAIVAAEERGELTDRDALIKENPRHADILLGFFAGRDFAQLTLAEKSLLSSEPKPNWWRRWWLGFQIAFVPLWAFQALIWTAEFIHVTNWDIDSLRVAAGLILMAVMFVGIPLSMYEMSYQMLARYQRRQRAGD